MAEYRSLSHTKWDCKYHVIFIPKRRKKVALWESLGINFISICKVKPPALAGEFDFQSFDLCVFNEVRFGDFGRLHPTALTHLL